MVEGTGTVAAKVMMGVVETQEVAMVGAARETAEVVVETATMAAMAMLAETGVLGTPGAAMLAVQPEVAQETVTAMAVAEGVPLEAALVAAWAVDLAGM